MTHIIEKQRETNVIESCDILVAGGGIAGISAAIAGARAGAKVVLVEKECLLGGLATLGLVTIYLPLCDGMGRQVSFGISEELLHLSIKNGVEARYPKPWLEGGSLKEKTETRFLVQYNPHLFALEAERLLLSLGVEILYDTLICETAESGDKITHIIIENKSGRNAIAVKSVIDCTGDADICELSQADTVLFTQKNILAGWYYYLTDGELKLRMLGAADIPDEQRTAENTPKLLSEARFTGIDGEEISRMLCMSHEAMLRDILEKRIGDKSHTPVTTPTIPQLRMTRRLDGAYTMSDTESHTYFEDSVGLIGDWRKRGPVYEIPFRTLYGNKVKNLLTAGRCISVTDSMWDISRVIPACAVTGEAAGIAASITDDFSSIDIKELQHRLAQNNVVLHESELDNYNGQQ